MIEDVIPAIKTHMPRPEGHTIFVQQDGAKPHIKGGVMEAIEEVAGNNIVTETQSANSPGFNISDLGFFHSIQQLKEEVGVTNTEELVKVKMEVFNMYPGDTRVHLAEPLRSLHTVKCWGPRVSRSSKFLILARKRLRRRVRSPQMPWWLQRDTVLEWSFEGLRDRNHRYV
ncbi:unnamed protein product [Choristocarpus tenellus]